MATTVTLKPNAIDISGSTSGTTTLQATAVAGTTTLTLPAATDTLVGKATTDTLTNKTLTGAVMNGTLGATTPSTVAATSITASTTLGVTGVATFSAGTAALPAITTTGDTNTGIFFPAADTIAFTEGGAEAMRIDTSGNVGIGTTSPRAVAGYTSLGINNTTGSLLDMNVNGTRTTSLTVISTETQFGTITATPLAFWSNNAERMRIDSSGNLLVGTTSASNPPTQGISLFGAQTNSQLAVGHETGTGSGQYYTVFGYAGTTIGGITQNGTTAVAYNTSSDYRLKNTIAPMTDALAKVQALKPVTYKWNADGSDGQGFIAHELQAVIPDCVTGEKDGTEIYIDEDGNEQTKPQYQGIDTSFLVATLTAAIQEQQALITALTARITALESI